MGLFTFFFCTVLKIYFLIIQYWLFQDRCGKFSLYLQVWTFGFIFTTVPMFSPAEVKTIQPVKKEKKMMKKKLPVTQRNNYLYKSI